MPGTAESGIDQRSLTARARKSCGPAVRLRIEAHAEKVFLPVPNVHHWIVFSLRVRFPSRLEQQGTDQAKSTPA